MAQTNSGHYKLKPPWWRRLLRSLIRSPRDTQVRHIIVYTKKPCPLCDEALATINTAGRTHALDLTVIDIDGRSELMATYGHEVPVVYIDGTRRFFGKVDRVLLNRILDHA